MEESLFQRSLAFVMKWEGGFINHPADRGGPTNRGVTQTTYDAWRRSKQLPLRSVREIDADEVREIYRGSYWEPHCGDLRWPLCLVAFDTRVNFGVRGSSFLIQPILGVTVDGVWGNQTQSALIERQSRWGPQRVAFEIVRSRIQYRIQRISTNPSQQVFLAGWINRDVDLLREVMESCLDLSQNT